MKFVLFSDLHLDAQFAWAGHEVARRRRQSLRDTLSRIVDVTLEVGADALLCAGDLYEHERFSPDTAQFVRSSFERLGRVPVFITPGNHDWFGPESLYRQVEWTPNVRVFHNDRLEPVTFADGLTIWGAAHRAPANTDGFLESFKVDRAGIHLALFHGSERGFFAFQEQGKIPHAPFDEGEIHQAGLHHALLGHFHHPRDAAAYTYPGNPDPLTFGEDGERGVVIVTVLDEGTVTRERRHVGGTVIHDMTVDVTGCRSLQEVRERAKEQLQGFVGLVRVTVVGDLAVEVDLHPSDLTDVAPWLEAVLPRAGNIRVGYDLNSIAQDPTVRGQFVRDVRDADLPEEERYRVLTTGLRALDERDDLEVL